MKLIRQPEMVIMQITDRYNILKKWTKAALITRLLDLNPLGGYDRKASRDILIATVLRYEYGPEQYKTWKESC